ncbi:unnamed protein product [Prorocentrum cordatum]|uniref:Uncharacterized protein n=1 Tax=Prorocentrum cordatum TaxID=2364126 RepID=A0ABN9Q986_9DINO|nr:unnamed protein product [Polarella glacialis]
MRTASRGTWPDRQTVSIPSSSMRPPTFLSILDLETIGKVIENVSTRVLPNMERTLQVSPNITTFVGSFLNMARLEVGGLQEAAHSMVTRASPIIAERVQCTFSSARQRIGLNLLSAVVVFATPWLLH